MKRDRVAPGSISRGREFGDKWRLGKLRLTVHLCYTEFVMGIYYAWVAAYSDSLASLSV